MFRSIPEGNSGMATSSEPSCLLAMIFLFNSIIMLIGIGVATVGILVLLLNPYVAYILIGLGSLLVFVTIFGCISLVGRSKKSLNIYSSFLVFLLIVEATACVLAFTYGNDAKKLLINGLSDQMMGDKYFANGTETLIVDFLQKNLQCCGSRDPYTWERRPYGTLVPLSCCVNKHYCDRHYDIDHLIYYGYIYDDGCMTKILDSFTNDNKWNILGPVAGIAVMQILLMIFAYLTSFMLQVSNRVVPEHARPSSNVPI